jgi:hypothetical protein
MPRSRLRIAARQAVLRHLFQNLIDARGARSRETFAVLLLIVISASEFQLDDIPLPPGQLSECCWNDARREDGDCHVRSIREPLPGGTVTAAKSAEA